MRIQKGNVNYHLALALCNFKKCDEGQKCVLDEAKNEARCACKSILECPFKYKPICGSDHVTYASSCIMGMASCKKRTQITRLSEGICPKGMHLLVCHLPDQKPSGILKIIREV